MDDERLLFRVKPGEGLHRWVQAEEAVERQRRMRALALQGELAVQIRIVGIAKRADDGKTIQRAAQDDDDEPRIARAGCARPSRQVGGGEDRSLTRRESVDGSDAEARHAHLLWNSGERINSA